MFTSDNHFDALEFYVGKHYYIDFNKVHIEFLLGGDEGPPFYLCRWDWSDEVFCASPLEILVHFDDDSNPIKDFDFDENEIGAIIEHNDTNPKTDNI